MKKQRTLDKFFGLREEDASSSDAASYSSEPGKQKTPSQYWTSVKERSQLDNKKVCSFNIEKDVAALVNENDYKQECQTASKTYLFDTDSFKQKDTSLVPENHALTVD